MRWMNGVGRSYVSDFLCHVIQLTALQIQVLLVLWLWEPKKENWAAHFLKIATMQKAKSV